MRLCQIAKLLGKPVSAFDDAAAGERMLQLLRLWDAMPDAAAQEATLRAMRALVAPPSIDASAVR